MLKIRRPLGRLIFNMGIAIPGKTVFLIETAPSTSGAMRYCNRLWNNNTHCRVYTYPRAISKTPLFMYFKSSTTTAQKKGVIMSSFNINFKIVTASNFDWLSRSRGLSSLTTINTLSQWLRHSIVHLISFRLILGILNYPMLSVKGVLCHQDGNKHTFWRVLGHSWRRLHLQCFGT